MAVGALLTGLPVKELVRNLLPILLLCAGICLALIKAAEATIRVLSVVGNLVRIARDVYTRQPVQRADGTWSCQ